MWGRRTRRIGPRRRRSERCRRSPSRRGSHSSGCSSSPSNVCFHVSGDVSSGQGVPVTARPGPATPGRAARAARAERAICRLNSCGSRLVPRGGEAVRRRRRWRSRSCASRHHRWSTCGTIASGCSWASARTGRTWRTSPAAAVLHLADRALGRDDRATLAADGFFRRGAGNSSRPARPVRRDSCCAQRRGSHLSRKVMSRCIRSGPVEDVLERQQDRLAGAVLHRDHALRRGSRSSRWGQPSATSRTASRARPQTQPVALVEVRLPVNGVVLLGPGHMPHCRAREAHSGITR